VHHGRVGAAQATAEGYAVCRGIICRQTCPCCNGCGWLCIGTRRHPQTPANTHTQTVRRTLTCIACIRYRPQISQSAWIPCRCAISKSGSCFGFWSEPAPLKRRVPNWVRPAAVPLTCMARVPVALHTAVLVLGHVDRLETMIPACNARRTASEKRNELTSGAPVRGMSTTHGLRSC
jgi:hypothetical protein